MTYTHKLARRLARLRGGWLALPAAAIAACSGADASRDMSGPESPAAAVPASLALSPDTLRLQVAESGRFSARASTAAGDSTALPELVWSASGGRLGPDGLFTADSVGTYGIVAQASGGALRDSAVVVVTRSPADSLPPATPPSTPPSAPPLPGTHPLAAECGQPGTGWIWCDDFEQDRLASYFEYHGEGGSFARTAGIGSEGSYAMRARFAAGQVSAGALHLAFGKTPSPAFRPVDAGTAKYREIYWRLYVRNAPDWTGGGGDKLSRVISFASPEWAQSMKGAVWSGDKTTTRDHLVIEPISGTDSAGTLTSTEYNDFGNQRYLGPVTGPTPLFDAGHVGRWSCVEAHVRLNDAGRANGVFELWLDGKPEAARSDLNWVGAYDAYGLNAVFVENYWNAGSPRAQERYIDNLVVSTQRIGC